MEFNKRVFIKERLFEFLLTESEKKQVIESASKDWDSRFDFLSGKDIMPFLIEKDIEPSLAFKMMESIRKGKGLTHEWEKILSEKDISLDFITRYENTLPISEIGAYFSSFLTEKVNEAKQLNCH
ncbi:hypothetical protein [Bacillus thuringiensis]|uniref:Uncharacterized protein n=1 Tax=Bacillus thuringiensis TaxID=1428 RepID=A0A9X6ZPM7_BACTU|nr:hypothetical protein [Bacillus thuringiensis]PFJ28996.1 hypothetical protein COJ15_32545 [Bacillus thuringiensis]